jgi:hypothetical protein
LHCHGFLINARNPLVYIGVFAYGEQRFELTFNPCNANINSLCPLNSSIPIEASGIIPVAQSDVAGIPSMALTIPDFEGEAILRIFANSTESQIGCYSAVVTNGATFSHPAAIGAILGIFALVALVSSVAVAAYGESVPEIRKHYAHSISVFVVFEVFQHIFFTGALSMNWPSVLVAFWSNYAWSAGMIYSKKMQDSINQFIGDNRGNISMVGAAASGVNANDLGGGYSIGQIYKRTLSFFSGMLQDVGTTRRPRDFEHALARRDLVNSSTGYSRYGGPVRPGLPLPGNYSGFAGTLGQENIPASNAFLTGLLWLLILIVCVVAGMVALKWTVEGLSRCHVVKTQRLAFFRAHWLAYTSAAVLRICFIAFFMMVFLTTFQFTLGGSSGVKAIAGIILVIFLLGMLGLAGYALFYRLRSGKYSLSPDRLNIERKGFGFLPWYGFTRESIFKEKEEARVFAGSLPWWRVECVDKDAARVPVHNDEDYNKKFGWLSARFRQTKWWFFSAWLVYELVRACFYGVAAGHAMTQVFGLLVVEAVALISMVLVRPFESNRLNVLMVYLVGFSKVVTVALSSAFDARFNLPRITTTAIGIVIIVIQGVVTIILMILIVLGAISSYMSISRNREQFKPRSWARYRTRYFVHVDQKATDQPAPRPTARKPIAATPMIPSEPYFKVASVRREPKIEDEDENNQLDGPDEHDTSAAHLGETNDRPYSRTHSLKSRASVSNLPYGARRHRASWSSRDLIQMYDEGPQHNTPSRMSVDSQRDIQPRSRAASQRLSGAPSVLQMPEGQDIQTDRRRVRSSTLDGKTQTKNVKEDEMEN